MLVPETMSPKFRGAQVALLQTPWGTGCRVQKSAKQRLRGPKLCGANIEGKFAPQSFGPLNLCPAEFWTPQPVPRGVLEQCNLCPAEFWRHSFRAPKKLKKMIKKLHFPSFLRVFL